MSAYVRLSCDICSEEIDAYGSYPAELPELGRRLAEDWGVLEVALGDQRIACPECMRRGSDPKGGAASG